jgi:hypothetical protein
VSFFVKFFDGSITLAVLDLPDSPRTRVWLALVAQLQADPALSACIATWLVWDGTRDCTAALTAETAPTLRLTPTTEPMSWYDASAQIGYLVVNIEAYIPSEDVRDVLNLQGAIEGALYPADAGAFQRSLVALGAQTGLVEFTGTLSETPSAMKEGAFRPLGTLRVAVLRQLIP